MSLHSGPAPLLSHRRIILLTDGYSTPFLAKTAISMLRYRPGDIVAILDRVTSATTAQELYGVGGDIPVVSAVTDAADPDALYVGIAPPGGRLPEEWRPVISLALQHGCDVVSGLHDFLEDVPDYQRLSQEHGKKLIDVRRNRCRSTATGQPYRAGCLRLHTVGHDCSVGKMVVALEVERGLAARGHDARFLATGQTGMMISGRGVPIDCVVADFVNGAAEQLVREHEHHDFVLIEGQGSLSHPAFSGVTLGLLHGCAPDGLIFCYEAGREQVKGLDGIDIPPLASLIASYEMMAGLRHPCRVIGVAINTRTLSETEAHDAIARAENQFGLPVCDVYRTGAEVLVDAAVQLREEGLARCK